MFRIRIRELREGAGFRSQQSFADAFGVAQTTVASWEGGKREPGHETTIRLAEFFNVTVDYLLGHDTIPTLTNASIKQDDPAKPTTPLDFQLSAFELEIIRKLRLLSEEQQRVFLAYLTTLLNTQVP